MSENLNYNELRIGNLFIEEKTKTIIKVIELTEEIISFSGNFKNYWQAKPIKLTEDWLLKLGFVKNKFDGHYEKGEFYIEVWEKDFVFRWNYFNIDINLNSVHRLQNLYFALNGQELNLIKRYENTNP
jgi:hypothetical protein